MNLDDNDVNVGSWIVMNLSFWCGMLMVGDTVFEVGEELYGHSVLSI